MQRMPSSRTGQLRSSQRRNNNTSFATSRTVGRSSLLRFERRSSDLERPAKQDITVGDFTLLQGRSKKTAGAFRLTIHAPKLDSQSDCLRRIRNDVLNLLKPPSTEGCVSERGRH